MKHLWLLFSLLFFFSCEDKKEKDDSDTQNPSVEILSPANNAEVWGTITIKVFAEDDNAVERVELFVAGDTLVRTMQNPTNLNGTPRFLMITISLTF